ncbi:hypothetical protein O181_033761 [Austropuccinia psidii MF-1]|uniref:Uncharacterized protein n=1 Tax=Austropuccinia psidii MF-1 TaxID=1389203 RepID=A0A9Q3D522_9BASI|nr:hypothetical protein [Austropuccinia psidii MF-1]
MPIELHSLEDTGRLCNNPGGAFCEALACWHKSQAEIKSTSSQPQTWARKGPSDNGEHTCQTLISPCRLKTVTRQRRWDRSAGLEKTKCGSGHKRDCQEMPIIPREIGPRDGLIILSIGALVVFESGI